MMEPKKLYGDMSKSQLIESATNNANLWIQLESTAAKERMYVFNNQSLKDQNARSKLAFQTQM